MTTNYTRLTDEYQTWLDTLGFSRSIVYEFPKMVNDFFEWLRTKNVQKVTELTRNHLKEYLNHLEHRPNKRRKGLISTAHVNRITLALDKLLEFLHQMGVKTVPMPMNQRIKHDEQERINNIDILTKTEIKELYNDIENTYPSLNYLRREKIHHQLKLVFALYYACGLRRSEGHRLTIKDINFDNRTVFVEKGKNYKDRIIPMSNGVYRDLENYIYNYRHREKVNHKRLFISTSGALLKNLQNLQRQSKNEQIRTKRMTFHNLRHSIATHLLQNEMDIENIKQFLGHSSLTSTQLYTHIISENKL